MTVEDTSTGQEPVYLYSLAHVAKTTGHTYNYVKTVIGRLKEKDAPLVWKGFEFIQVGQRQWLAIDLNSPIRYVS